MTPMLETVVSRSLTLDSARRLADLAIEEATARGLKIHVAVVDPAGNLLVYFKMPGAPLPARKFAEGKAYTAVSFKKPTAAWKDRLTANPHLAHGLSRHPQATFIGGGAPVTADGEVVGAIGVAGGLEADDVAIVDAVLGRVG
jgi:uncharacterized protein GlcG (DUF336 family)